MFCVYVRICVCRIKWQKIRAVQMYIEHLILPFAENESVANGAYRFWLVIAQFQSPDLNIYI